MTKLQQWLVDTANHKPVVRNGEVLYYTESHRPIIHCQKWPPMIFEVGVSFPCTPQRSCSKEWPTEYTQICIESPLPIDILADYIFTKEWYCGYEPIYQYRYGFVPIELAERVLREKRGKLEHRTKT